MRTLVEQAAAIISREVSSAELVDAALDAIARTQPVLNAWTSVLADDARERAKALDTRSPSGPLHGVPIAVKDLYDVAGVPTTGCCAAYHDRIARSDSAVVELLREAGAVIVAKTNQHELACGATTQVSSFGPCANPWAPGRVPGGSSGGSGAAVAAGVVAMAMGSDTGGSIRIPSSLCGVTGLKPTYGAISLRGAMPMCPSFDTAGPLAVSAQDCELVWRVVRGFDPDDPLSQDAPPLTGAGRPGRMRVAILRSFLDAADPEVVDAVRAAAAALEAADVEIDEVDGPDLQRASQAWLGIGLPEVPDVFRDLWEDDRVAPPLKAWFAAGRAQPAIDYARAVRLAREVRREFEWPLTANDALLTPCTPCAAPLAEDASDVRLSMLTAPVNVAGLPALAFPVGFSSGGLPLGAQLIGRPWSEDALLSLGASYQAATDWHQRLAPAAGG